MLAIPFLDQMRWRHRYVATRAARRADSLKELNQVTDVSSPVSAGHNTRTARARASGNREGEKDWEGALHGWPTGRHPPFGQSHRWTRKSSRERNGHV